MTKWLGTTNCSFFLSSSSLPPSPSLFSFELPLRRFLPWAGRRKERGRRGRELVLPHKSSGAVVPESYYLFRPRPTTAAATAPAASDRALSLSELVVMAGPQRRRRAAADDRVLLRRRRRYDAAAPYYYYFVALFCFAFLFFYPRCTTTTTTANRRRRRRVALSGCSVQFAHHHASRWMSRSGSSCVFWFPMNRDAFAGSAAYCTVLTVQSCTLWTASLYYPVVASIIIMILGQREIIRTANTKRTGFL